MQAGIAVALEAGRWFLFSEDNWTTVFSIYSLGPKKMRQARGREMWRRRSRASHSEAAQERGIAPPSMSARHRVTFVPQILRQLQLHLERRLVRHRIQMRIQLRQ